MHCSSFRDGKEIVSRSENDRVSIVRTRAEHGSYELVIADVQPGDAGLYACRAMNIYGEVETEAKVTVVGKILHLQHLNMLIIQALKRCYEYKQVVVWTI